jgi:DNA-binding transcriptional LysR family regulator
MAELDGHGERIAMNYLEAMRMFQRSAELGSFSKAAAEIGVKVSSVSRAVAGLEADLGAALFNRSTRRLNLTEVGRTFFESARRILADVEAARLEAASLNRRPQGLLRIELPTAFGRRHVMPLLPEFLTRYSDIRVEATLSDETVDLIAAGADLAVRIGALADSSLVARRLAPHRRILCAAPAYLARAEAVVAPADLRRQECLVFTRQPGPHWYFRAPGSETLEPVEPRGRLHCNDSEALLGAALAGLGIALLPAWLAGPDLASDRLTALLAGWQASMAPGPERGIWAVYPPKKVVSPKVRVFLDFLAERFGNPPYWERDLPKDGAATPARRRKAVLRRGGS